ncbi:MAG TPA: hypothetical protein VGI68_17985 [Mycobacterium sp.]
MTFDEDRSQVRAGTLPRLMATLRNTAISILRLAGHPSIAQAPRYHSRNPEQAQPRARPERPAVPVPVSGPDFSERDRALLTLIRPHLHRAYLDAERRRPRPTASRPPKGLPRRSEGADAAGLRGRPMLRPGP